MSRATWDEYFMRVAVEVSSRATCDRLHVGAVIVRDKSILASGYNGAPRGLPHCDEVGHELENGSCVRVVHAEANAIIQAARHGVAVDGATIYVTHSPCYGCAKLLANAGIARVVYGEAFRDARGLDMAAAMGMDVVLLQGGAMGAPEPRMPPQR